MRLTRLGKSIAAASLAAVAAWVLDAYLPSLIAGAVLIALIAIDMLAMKVYLMTPSYLEPAPARLETSRGAEVKLKLRLKGRRPRSISVSGGVAKELTPGRVYELSIRPSRAGEIEISEARARYLSFLRLIEVDELMPLRPKASVVVHPSSLALIRAVLAAGVMSGGLLGGPAPPIIGRGDEYAYTDELRPGEDASRMDWRATARKGKPMVKRFYAEWASSATVVIDITATDEVSADEIAGEAAALLMATGQLPNAQYYIYDGTRLLRAASPQEAAVVVLKSLGRYYPEVNRVLDDYPGLRPALAQSEAIEGQRVIAVTQLLSGLTSMLPPRCVIIQPTRPWIWAPDLAEAYLIRVRHDRARSLAEAAGCRVFRSAAEAVRALGLVA